MSLLRALADRPLPCAFVDLDAFDENAAHLETLARGVPIRVASKSVRCVALLRRVLARPGWSGILAYSAREAAALVRHGLDDVVVAYPTVVAADLDAAIDAVRAGARIALMIDDPAHVQAASARATAGGVTLKLWIDIDASLRLPGLHFGVRRSPVQRADQALALARSIADTPGVSLDGLMMYEAQIAGIPDRGAGAATDAALGLLKRRSWKELTARRAAIVAALRDAGFATTRVNGGGTGSLGQSAGDPTLTEVAAGSGLFRPASFDGYNTLMGRPAAGFALPVTRRPGPGLVTCAGGGYVASGPSGADRLPRPWLPEGLALLPREGAGEVQTPLRVPPGVDLGIGDPVAFRHAKAGELCERFDRLLLVRGGHVVDEVPTYRGQGLAFG